MVGSGRLACSGLDCISDFSITAQRFTAPAGVNAHTYFADCFGITRPTDRPGSQEILLRFTPVQGRYALSYPTAFLTTSGTGKQCGNLPAPTVDDTHELRIELLSYGPDVEMLAPASLRVWVQQAYAAAAHLPVGQNYLASASPIFFKMRLG